MLKERIRDLLKKKSGILLAHNYQRPQMQDVAGLCTEMASSSFLIRIRFIPAGPGICASVVSQK